MVFQFFEYDCCQHIYIIQAWRHSWLSLTINFTYDLSLRSSKVEPRQLKCESFTFGQCTLDLGGVLASLSDVDNPEICQECIFLCCLFFRKVAILFVSTSARFYGPSFESCFKLILFLEVGTGKYYVKRSFPYYFVRH